MRAEVSWHGDAATDRMRAAAVSGLGLAAEHVLGASRQRVPLEEGTLERSGATDVDESALTAAVSYDTPYARRQHEELDWRHAPGRTAKYLEEPLNEEIPVVREILATALRRALQ